MKNRDLLKEAIADAKTIKESAINNAKAVLEEAFTPYLKEKLAAKLSEMDEMDEEVDLQETEEIDEVFEEEMETTEEEMNFEEIEETEVDEIDLEGLLRELDELDENEEESENLSEAEEIEVMDDDEDEEINLDDMSEDDLKSFIESVITDMVSSGELEGNIESEDEDDMDMDMDMELEDEDEVETPVSEDKESKEMELEMESVKKELNEAYKALETIKSEFDETKLLNAKLLYTNKIYKAKNLTESQKVKVLEAFDKAASVKEAKLVYETLSGNFNSTVKKPINESLLRGSASKSAGVAERKNIIEPDAHVLRMQKLAGIIK
jgi:hypothetical protein